jgi:hypothetical protein
MGLRYHRSTTVIAECRNGRVRMRPSRSAVMKQDRLRFSPFMRHAGCWMLYELCKGTE